jgi:hypothetical protein
MSYKGTSSKKKRKKVNKLKINLCFVKKPVLKKKRKRLIG